MKQIPLFLMFCISLTAGAQTADFAFQTTSGAFCVPATVQFTHSASETPTGFIWDFGDGTRSNDANPAHTYSAAGTYEVSLLAIFRQSTASVQKTITIHQTDVISLHADRDFICTAGNIDFTTGGSTQVSYEWQFGDGTSQTTTSGNIAHTFSADGNYSVQVIGTDANGCRAVAQTVVEFKPPEISASFSPTAGCIPAITGFQAEVQLPAGSTVSSYQWDFGDGNSAITTTNQATYSYTVRGSFQPRLNIITSEGCTAEFNFSTAAFGVPPTIEDAYAARDTFCASETMQFIAVAPGANRYAWQFGDGTSATLADTIVTHRYRELGEKNITVTPLDNGCPGSAVSFPVEVTGVVARYGYLVECSRRNQVTFANNSLGQVTSFLWEYGDGQQNDSIESPTHSLPAEGAFPVVLSVRDSLTGCADQIMQTIHTATPTLTLADTSVCRDEFIVFYVENGYENPDARYTYHIAGTVTGASPYNYMSIRPQHHGTFDNFVIIDNGPEYCRDTVYLDHQLLVRGPVADFSSETAICLNDSLSLTNLSRPFLPQDTIVGWKWKVDQNDSLMTAGPGSFTFPSAGSKSIQLIASDIHGCVDSITKSVTVNHLPFLDKIPFSDTICAGETDTLIAFHNDPVLWTSSNPIDCNDCDSLIVMPENSGFYALETTSSLGCTSRDTIHLVVHPRLNAMPINPFSDICPGDTVTLQVAPPDMEIRWSSATGLSGSTAYNPVVSPETDTRFVAVLSDSAGCFSDSATFDVHVRPPATIELDPERVVSYNAPFTLNPVYSDNVVSYEWSPRGDLNCISCAMPSGVAEKSHVYHIRATSDSGCVVNDSVHVVIECSDANLLLPNAFTPDSDGLNDVFYPIGRGVSLIRNFRIYNRYGEVVFAKSDFESNDKISGWDGRIKGEPAPAGVYVYTVEAVCDQGQPVIKKGTITLIR